MGLSAREVETLLAEWQGRLYAVAFNVLGNAADAEDAVQNAALAIIRGAGSFHKGEPVGPWVYRIGTNAAVSILRRRPRKEQAMTGEPAAPAETGVEQAELRAAVRAAVGTLPENERLSVVLHYFEGLKLGEVAAVLEMPEPTVNWHLARGRERLRTRLGALGGALAALPAAALDAAMQSAGQVTMPARLAGQLGQLAHAQLHGAAATAALKGGVLMKIGLGVAAVGLAAGATFLAVGGKAEDKPGPSAEKPAAPGDWRQEQWTVENFTGAPGGGPGWGPVEECGSFAYSVCGDKAGNMYIANGKTVQGHTIQSVDIITKDGVRYRLAGTGEAGYRDGPAETAQFRIGIGAYYEAFNIQADGRGNIFVPDNGNGCVRRIFKNAEGGWTVETWAGSGKRQLKAGESCPPREAQLSGTLMVAAAQDGQVTIASTGTGCLQISPDGKVITGRGPWPAYRGHPNPEKGVYPPPWQGGDCDRAGNAYFVSRTPDLIYRVTPDGKMEHIGINPALRGKNVGDGPPFDIYFDTPDSGCVAPDGSGVYVCGGDEYDIRKVPTDLLSPSATLMNNGRWYSCTANPRNMGGKGDAGYIDAALSGKPRNEGGPLKVFSNCHLAGRDFDGNLYGSQYRWCGTTVSTKEKGLLGTRVYRIRRVK